MRFRRIVAKRRWVRKVARGKPPAPYRSWLEHDLHKGPLKGLAFEPEKIPYIVPALYIPDFVNYDKNIIIETKGRFEEAREAAKYIHFRDCNPLWTLVFVFERPSCPMPNSRKRKDGTRFTHGDWATKNGFDFSCPRTVKKEWL